MTTGTETALLNSDGGDQQSIAALSPGAAAVVSTSNPCQGAARNSTRPPSIVAMLHGPDRPGIVARVAGWIFENGGNILHADQHRDAEENVFFQRVEWSQPDDITELRRTARTFAAMARETLGMSVRMALSHESPRVGILVSKGAHCLQDIACRWKRGELHGNLTCVISNHPNLQGFCQSMSLPFHYVEMIRTNKIETEDIELKIFHRYRIDLLIMARYMQVLSPHFLESIGVPVINIHHSFLPAFPGSNPYRQAYARGVKVIGATAHYATAELDQGPIIAQDIVQITHRHSVGDFIQKGQDLEQRVLAQAVRCHLENRVLVYNNKTIVFD
jgi:formyltetrahydrofolate deformylase